MSIAVERVPEWWCGVFGIEADGLSKEKAHRDGGPFS